MAQTHRPPHASQAKPTRAIQVALALSALTLLAGCIAAPTPYQAQQAGYGYSEEAGADGTWRVTFRGNEHTSEAAVEEHLFRRMAQLAEREGADRFTVLEQTTDCITTLRTDEITTCTYRQPADATFPYYFGVAELEGRWGGPRRTYEATGFMRPGGEEPCLKELLCFETAEVLSAAPAGMAEANGA